MSFNKLIQDGIALADKLTGGPNAAVPDLQEEIIVERYAGKDKFGKVSYAAPTPMLALVDRKQQLVRTLGGDEAMTGAVLYFLREVTFHELDKITLKNGHTGPILNFGGFDDASTGNPYQTTVYLG
jgi:hypothetical protein